MLINKSNRAILFIVAFILPILYYRVRVFLMQGQISGLRTFTGLNIHHRHFGVIIVLIGIILLLFYQVSKTSIIITAWGMGTMLDSFISSLFYSGGRRAQEIINYDTNLLPTLILFVGVVYIVLYLSKDRVTSIN